MKSGIHKIDISIYTVLDLEAVSDIFPDGYIERIGDKVFFNWLI